MKQIAVLIDFTDLCKFSASQAAVLARQSGAQVCLVHVAQPKDRSVEEGIKDHMKPFAKIIQDQGLECTLRVGYGHFMDVIVDELNDLQPDLVVTGTHGIHGIRQNLFGSNILALVQRLPFPTLVVQDIRPAKEEGFRHILFPLGAHDDFDIQIRQCARIAKLNDATVIAYIIIKTDAGPGEAIENNLKKTHEYFSEHGVKYQVIEQQATVYSFGYGKQIDMFAEQNGVDAIVVMSHSAPTSLMGNSDKEKILLNTAGIPVLCCNDRH